MSVESAKAFVEKMRRDAAFKQQILAAESAAKRRELIKSAGFDFERMHLDALVSELTPKERRCFDADVTLASGPISRFSWP